MIAAITGAAGFIGSHLVDRLAADGHRVVCLDARTRAASAWDYLQAMGGVVLTHGDVTVEQDVAGLLRHAPDICFHLAAESHVDASLADPISAFHVNATGTAIVARACIEHSVPLVYCSTDEVYGDLSGTPWEATGAYEEATPIRPSSPYSAGKAAGEFAVHSFCRSLGLRAVVVRGCNAFGARQFREKLVPIMCRRVHLGQPIPLHDGGYQVRQWIHVTEFSEILTQAGYYLLEQVKPGQAEVLHAAGPTRVSVRDLARRIQQFRAGTVDRSEPFRHAGARPGQDRCYHLSGERTATVLGVRPRRSITAAEELYELLASYPLPTAPPLVEDEAEAAGA